jgi:flotillin
MFEYLILIGAIVAILFLVLVALATRYKKCPSDRILVVYGKVGTGKSAQCYHGGAAFIWPIIQDYQYLNLTPLPIDIKLEGALSKQNIRVNTPSTFTVGIATEPGVMENAAERLLGLTMQHVTELAKDIIFGQMRVVIATMDIANAEATKGENTAEVDIANSNAQRRSAQAEAERLATAAEKVAQAKVLEEAYVAEQRAEQQRAERERSTQFANIVVPAEIAKERQIVEADAEAERLRRIQQGMSDAVRAEKQAEADGIKLVQLAEADGMKAKLLAEADGAQAILAGKAKGFKELIATCEGPSGAQQMLVTELLPQLVREQVQAISNLQIDKITVWDSGPGADGKGSTASFLSGLAGSVPPLHELAKNVGVELPEYLGKLNDRESKAPRSPGHDASI